MNIFITGMHRAGTHEAAQQIASENQAVYLEETVIGMDGFPLVEYLCNGFLPIGRDERGEWLVRKDNRLDAGFVLHCPGIAHKTLELAKKGKVYWVYRNKMDTVSSMKYHGIEEMAWHIMRRFHNEFPDDPIWQKLEGQYDGSEDRYSGFLVYHSLLVSVKDYFYRKYFKEVCESINTDEQSYYDSARSIAASKPLKAKHRDKIEKALERYEGICVDQA